MPIVENVDTNLIWFYALYEIIKIIYKRQQFVIIWYILYNPNVKASTLKQLTVQEQTHIDFIIP